jgi:hypothetical protein
VRHRFGKLRMGMFITATVAAAGLAFAGSASAAPKAPKMVPGTYCSTWIEGEWGHGKCTNNSGRTVAMDLHVECNAIWDPNVDRSAQIVTGASIEMQGHCWSSVDWVTANTR